MCLITSGSSSINVGLTLTEARRIGDLNVDIDEVEILRFRRKVRDAVRSHDEMRFGSDLGKTPQ